MRDGDIITLDYEGHTDGELFDTTLEKAAKDAGTHEEGRPYGPITVIIGEGRLVPGLEAALKKAKGRSERGDAAARGSVRPA